MNSENLYGQRLWLEDCGVKIKVKDIIKAKRAGVDYTGRYMFKLWRFYIKNSPVVSKR